MTKFKFFQKKPFTVALIVLGVVLISVISYCALQIYQGKGIEFEGQGLLLSRNIPKWDNRAEESEETIPEIEQKIYRDTGYGLEIKYPANFDVTHLYEENLLDTFSRDYVIFKKDDLTVNLAITDLEMAKKQTEAGRHEDAIDLAGISSERYEREKKILLEGELNEDCPDGIIVFGGCRILPNPQGVRFLVTYSFDPRGGAFDKTYTTYANGFRYDLSTDINLPMNFQNDDEIRDFLNNLFDPDYNLAHLNDRNHSAVSTLDAFASSFTEINPETGWRMYRNEALQFELEYPSDGWEVEVFGNFAHRFYSDFAITIKNIKEWNEPKIRIFPCGGGGMGFAVEKMRIANDFFAGRPAKSYYLLNSKVPIPSLVYMKDYPDSWSEENRIDVTSHSNMSKNSMEILQSILKSFKFLK